jgi:hypothetical protein
MTMGFFARAINQIAMTIVLPSPVGRSMTGMIFPAAHSL